MMNSTVSDGVAEGSSSSKKGKGRISSGGGGGEASSSNRGKEGRKSVGGGSGSTERGKGRS